MSLFNRLMGAQKGTTPFSEMVSEVKQIINQNRIEGLTPANAAGAISMESVDETVLGSISDTFQEISKELATLPKQMRNTISLESSQVQAGAIGAIIARGAKAHIQRPITVSGVSDEFTTFVGIGGMSDAYQARTVNMEAYDETETAKCEHYTVLYNLQTARQNPFGDAFFPTYVVAPDNLGVNIGIQITNVFKDAQHALTGEALKPQKRNVIDALIDSTILNSDGLKVVPILRVGTNDDNFVAPAVVPPMPVEVDGAPHDTAPLVVNKEINLLGLCQSDTLLSKGQRDITDTIDPAFALKNVYVDIGGDIIRLNVEATAYSNFVAAPQQNLRRVLLNFNPRSLYLKPDTTKVDGTALTALADITTGDLTVTFGLDMHGYLDTEVGQVEIISGGVLKLIKIWDNANDVQVPLTAGSVAGIVAAFASSKVVGWDADGTITNLNRRQRGQLVTMNEYRHVYGVPFRSPVTSLKPVTADTSSEAAELNTLISCTYAMTSNAAVTELLSMVDRLRSYTTLEGKGTVSEVPPESFGVGRFLLKPTLIEEDVDVLAEIMSLTSHEKSKDAQHVMVQRIRDAAYRLWLDSGWQAVVDSRVFGVSENPILLVGTDPMTARWLMIDGETRLGGPDFQHQLVVSPDLRVTGKIFLCFTYPGTGDNQVNPGSFGVCAMAPELVINLGISRNGSHNRELTVQPRFRHFVNIPVMGLLNVQNLPETMASKIAINNHPV